jgi:hypothetical protein
MPAGLFEEATLLAVAISFKRAWFDPGDKGLKRIGYNLSKLLRILAKATKSEDVLFLADSPITASDIDTEVSTLLWDGLLRRNESSGSNLLKISSPGWELLHELSEVRSYADILHTLPESVGSLFRTRTSTSEDEEATHDAEAEEAGYVTEPSADPRERAYLYKIEGVPVQPSLPEEAPPLAPFLGHSREDEDVDAGDIEDEWDIIEDDDEQGSEADEEDDEDDDEHGSEEGGEDDDVEPLDPDGGDIDERVDDDNPSIVSIDLDEAEIKKRAELVASWKNSYDVYIWLLAEMKLRLAQAPVARNVIEGRHFKIDMDKVVDRPSEADIRRFAKIISAYRPSMQDMHWLLAECQIIYERIKGRK